MKMHIQKSNKEVKWERMRCVQGLQIDPNNSLLDVQVLFLYYLLLLNVVPC